MNDIPMAKNIILTGITWYFNLDYYFFVYYAWAGILSP